MGATIGAVAALLLLFVGALLLWRRCKRQKRQRQLPMTRYPRHGPSIYGPSSNGVLSTIILPPDSDRTSRSRTTVITNWQFRQPVWKPPSLYWEKAEHYLSNASEKKVAQEEDDPHYRRSGAGRSVAFSRTAQAAPLSPDETLHEELANATTSLNRIVTRLALSGHSMDRKTFSPSAEAR